MLKTPSLCHLCAHDYKCIYEPAEDTYLLLDALEAELPNILALSPKLGLEIGCGSGCAITFLSKLLHPSPILCLATDINPDAVKATQTTAIQNLVSVDPILTSLTDGMHLDCVVDIIICNPPYVPTEEVTIQPHSAKTQSCDKYLAASWAGGLDGRFWIDQLLPRIHKLLSPDGCFIMILMDQNKPDEIINMARDRWNLKSKIILKRKAGQELLYALKFSY